MSRKRSKKTQPTPEEGLLEQMLQADRFDEALRLIDSGQVDPARVPHGIYEVADHPEPDLLRRFLDAGVDPNWNSMPPPVEMAAYRGRLANVKLLVEAGADLERDRPSYVLIRTISEEESEVACYLIAQGVGTAPDHALEAAFLGLDDVLEALIAAGVDPDCRGEYDTIENHHRHLYGKTSDLKRTLRELPEGDSSRADLERRLRSAVEELDRFTERYGQIRSVRPLPYPDATPLILAAAGGHRSTLELLVAEGADPLAADKYGRNAYHAAEMAEHHRLAEWLAQEWPELPVASLRDPDSVDLEDDEEEWDDFEPTLTLDDLPKPSRKQRIRYRLSSVQARLRSAASDAKFSKAVETLAERCGSAPEFDALGGCGARLARRPDVSLDDLRREAESLGVMMVVDGAGSTDSRLVVLPTRDPLDALVAFEVAGPNVDVTTDQIVAFFADRSANLHRLRGDLVGGRFLDVDGDEATRLGEEIYALCPDAVDQGEGFTPLVSELRKTGRFILWWD